MNIVLSTKRQPGQRPSSSATKTTAGRYPLLCSNILKMCKQLNLVNAILSYQSITTAVYYKLTLCGLFPIVWQASLCGWWKTKLSTCCNALFKTVSKLKKKLAVWFDLGEIREQLATFTSLAVRQQLRHLMPLLRAAPIKIHFFWRRTFRASRPEYLCSWDSSHLKLSPISPCSSGSFRAEGAVAAPSPRGLKLSFLCPRGEGSNWKNCSWISFSPQICSVAAASTLIRLWNLFCF